VQGISKRKPQQIELNSLAGKSSLLNLLGESRSFMPAKEIVSICPTNNKLFFSGLQVFINEPTRNT